LLPNGGKIKIIMAEKRYKIKDLPKKLKDREKNLRYRKYEK